MRVSYAWLKELLPAVPPPEELARRLLLLGFEAGAIEGTGPGFSGVAVGEVLEVRPHPNADRLRLCRVSDGKSTYAVVCGAPNVAAGQRVPLARVGARLPDGTRIKKSKIRGETSEGMICSAKELGIGGNGEGIHVLAADVPLGRDVAELLGGGDAVLEVDVTPNRPDCLSHLGLARELAIHLDLPRKEPAVPRLAEDGPAPFPVRVAEASECPRYLGRRLEGLRVGPSPAWLAERLKAAGLRPINNVVDVTNYVLLERGQPLHAFDADKLEGSRLEVRFAREGERLKALDGKDYALAPENLVIADARRPVAIAGVMGGEETGVTEATRRVFLECAYFRPGRVRASAKRLGLRTDSSYRFERGADPGGVPAAAARATALLIELCGGTAGPASDSAIGTPSERPAIEVSSERVNRILGTDHPAEKVERVLAALGRSDRAGGALQVRPPSWRHDLETPWDLAEEVGRHLGYDSVPSAMGPVRLSSEPVRWPAGEAAARLREALVGMGFWEAYTYDFVSRKDLDSLPDRPEPPRLANPVSEDWTFLRPTLLLGLLRSARTNVNRGARGARLFELGRVYDRGPDGAVSERGALAGLWTGSEPARPHWRTAPVEPDFHRIKGVAEALLAPWGVSWRPAAAPGPFHPKACLEACLPGGAALGRAGLLHPDLARAWDLEGPCAAFELDLDALAAREPGRERFKPVSPFPAAERDLSILVREELPYSDVESAALGLKLPELARLELADVFSGKGVPEGRKSLMLRLTFSRMDRTLRDEEIQAAVEKVLDALARSCGARLRGADAA